MSAARTMPVGGGRFGTNVPAAAWSAAATMRAGDVLRAGGSIAATAAVRAVTRRGDRAREARA